MLIKNVFYVYILQQQLHLLDIQRKMFFRFMSDILLNSQNVDLSESIELIIKIVFYVYVLQQQLHLLDVRIRLV